MKETITPTDIPCPICGEGTLMVHVEEDTRLAPCQYKVCTACGSEQADAEDMRVNKRLSKKIYCYPNNVYPVIQGAR